MAMKKSPWVAVYNAASCNGCDLEVLAMLTPRYDIERLGCLWRDSPRHSDILLVTGIATKQSAKRLKKIYDQMPKPKYVIAVGSCAISGGAFRKGHNFAGPVDKVIPVDAYVPGCPPRPESIIYAVAKILEKMK